MHDKFHHTVRKKTATFSDLKVKQNQHIKNAKSSFGPWNTSLGETTKKNVFLAVVKPQL